VTLSRSWAIWTRPPTRLRVWRPVYRPGSLRKTSSRVSSPIAYSSVWGVDLVFVMVDALENLDDADGVWTTLSTNGLHIDVGRQVYYGGQGGVSDAACPNCGSVELFSDFSAALDDWYKTGTADHGCPTCTRRSLINDWRLEPQWGVGHLQLTFWNWPPPNKQFQKAVSTYLNDHRLLYVCDKF
jgi:hypothetical protein